MKQRSHLLFGLLIIFTLNACGSSPRVTPEPAHTPVSQIATPEIPSRPLAKQICNCTLRFDNLSIENGLSQSSVHVIFQDHFGFLWFGTEDGLNRYDGYNFKVYKPDPDNPNSLSERWITDIVEDQQGILWISTRLGGLNSFDPQTEQFTPYRHDKENPASLNDNHVNTLFVDKDNHLWVGTDNGLDLFIPELKSFKHYPYNPTIPNSLSGKNVSVIYQDFRGEFWIGTSDGGLNGFDAQTGSFTPYQYNPNDENTISNNRVTAIEEDLNHTLWIGTHDGLNQFNPRTGQFTRIIHDDHDSNSLTNNAINALYADMAGNLWIGTNYGLDRHYRTGTRFFHYYNNPSFARSLSSNTILSIYEDRGGVLWFGTYGSGVNKYDRQRDRFAYYRNEPNDPNSLSGNFIFPIFVGQDDSVWVGTDGQGLNRFLRLTGQAIRYQNDPRDPNSIGSNDILSIYQDHTGYLWIGTSNGLERFDPQRETFTHYRREPDDPNSLSANIVYSVFDDRENQLWIGTFAGLDNLDRSTGIFTHYRPNPGDPTSISGGMVNSIYEDNKGYLWIGTIENGLNRLDKSTGQFTQFHFEPQNKQSLSSDSIQSIYQDTRGRLWIGTTGGGLNLYHPETNSFTYYLEKDGLPNGVVYGILEDDLGRLWLSTNFGISRFDPQTSTFRNFDTGDGLQSNEFNSNAYAKSRSGEMFFGGVDGLTTFYPQDITDNPYLPQVGLTSLTQDGKPLVLKSSVETLQHITLKWPQNSFEFEFASLIYNQPQKNQYAYMLEGFDSDWHYIGTKRDGRYTNLSGGAYTLLLKASNSDGSWSETPTRISLTVVPPFWQTTWFRILLGMISIAVVAGGIRLRIKRIQDRNRELERVVGERTYALEKRGTEMEALYQADEKIIRTVSLNQIFQVLVTVAIEMLHADRAAVFAWDEDQTCVLPRVSYGFDTKTLAVLRFTKGEGLVGEVLTTGKPSIVPELDPIILRPDIREAIVSEGIVSFVHIPITVDEKVVAVFNVGFTRPGAINDDIVRLFTALVQRASMSIANMQLFEQTKDLAVMEERNRLARDLHDSAKQKAFAALAQLGTARGMIKSNGNSGNVNPHLNEAENLVSEVIQELTFLIQEIYPIALQEKGLVAVLREYIFEWENRNDARVHLAIQNERRISLEIEQAIYRVSQETLANAARHSHATRIDISLVYNMDSLQLSIMDNGCGFDVGEKSRGMGLRSIRERIGSVHGTVQIQSAPGQGTRLFVQVPAKS